MGFNVSKGDVSRRDVLKTGLKTGAYVAPLIVSSALATGVGAVSPTPTRIVPTPTAVVPVPLIALSKTVIGVPTVANGKTTTFAVAVKNNTGNTLANVVISDPLSAFVRSGGGNFSQLMFPSPPAGVTGDPATGLVTIAALGPNATTTFNVSAKLDSALSVGDTITNTATSVSANGVAISPVVTGTAVFTADTAFA